MLSYPDKLGSISLISLLSSLWYVNLWFHSRGVDGDGNLYLHDHVSTFLYKEQTYSYHTMKKILILRFGEIGPQCSVTARYCWEGFRTILVQLPHCKMGETEARTMEMISLRTQN